MPFKSLFYHFAMEQILAPSVTVHPAEGCLIEVWVLQSPLLSLLPFSMWSLLFVVHKVSNQPYIVLQKELLLYIWCVCG